MKFDLDPSLTKVAVMGMLLFIETFLGSLLVILNEGKMPSLIQFCTMLAVACLAIVTYFLTFLHTGDTETKK